MKKRNFGAVFVLLSAIFFALGGLLMKSVSWQAVSLNGARCLLAFFVMLPYMILTKHRFVFNRVVLFGAIINFGLSLTFAMANKFTTAANAIVLQFTMPAFLIIFLLVFWKQKPDLMQLITVTASGVGIVFFFFDSLTASGLVGNILAIVSGVFYALVFCIKKMPGSDLESSILLSHAICFVVGLPFIVQESDWSALNMLEILLLGVIQVGLAYVCLSIGLLTVQPVAASLISMIEPVLNPILVAVVLGETIGPLALVGAVIVIGSATVYNVMTAKRSEQTEKKAA